LFPGTVAPPLIGLLDPLVFFDRFMLCLPPLWPLSFPLVGTLEVDVAVGIVVLLLP
jgi:hypothetical protein